MAQPPSNSPMIPGMRARAMIAGPASTTRNSTRKLNAAPSGAWMDRIMFAPSLDGSSLFDPDQGDVAVTRRHRVAEPPLREAIDRAVGEERPDRRVDRLEVL